MRQNKDRNENKKRSQKEIMEEEFQKWVPRTRLGRMVKNNEIETLDALFHINERIQEKEIISRLAPRLSIEIISIDRIVRMTGSGGRRRILVTCCAFLEGYLGIGMAKGESMFDAMRLATKRAKLDLQPISRGCGAWSCGCGNTQHTIPYKTEGRSGSVRVKLVPAPRGTGLGIGDIGRKILSSVGIKDIHSQSFGHTRTTKNNALAILNAIRNLHQHVKKDYESPVEEISPMISDSKEEKSETNLEKEIADETNE